MVEDGYPTFLSEFFDKFYGGGKTKFPRVAVTAFKGGGVRLWSE